MNHAPADGWPIAEVSRMAGVSSRTLRHYHQIGLLSPARTDHNGYRYYRQQELLRLQRILLLRKLGLGLDAIGEVLAGQTDEIGALEVHRGWLLAERDRLARMAETLTSTIAELRQGGTMAAQEMFKGFDTNPYEDEARARWGDAAVDDSRARLAALGPGQQQAAMAEAAAINSELARCLSAGLPADAGAVQAAVHRHYRWVCNSWTPHRDSYVGLGRLYVEDARFTAFYDGVAPGLAHYLREAMEVYAEENLGTG